uniref:Uncharacterized protein n=1 Tax=Anguilla anguilla TaxID=7936 RepID=A0A0E9QPI0_ANGAN
MLTCLTDRILIAPGDWETPTPEMHHL